MDSLNAQLKDSLGKFGSLEQTVQASEADEAARRRMDRLGWDELTVEQKVERMRAIVKGIDANSHQHWNRLEQLGQQMRHHVHGPAGVLMPLDVKETGFGTAEARMPDGKVYF